MLVLVIVLSLVWGSVHGRLCMLLYCICLDTSHSDRQAFQFTLLCLRLSMCNLTSCVVRSTVDDFSEESSFYELLPCCARFRCADLISEGQWHHLVLVMSKGMLKNSMATLYIDGQLVNTVKVRRLTWTRFNFPGFYSPDSDLLFLDFITIFPYSWFQNAQCSFIQSCSFFMPHNTLPLLKLIISY